MGFVGPLIIGLVAGTVIGLLVGALGAAAKRGDEMVGIDSRWEAEAYQRAVAEDQLEHGQAALARVWELYKSNRIHLPGGERDQFLWLMRRADATPKAAAGLLVGPDETSDRAAELGTPARSDARTGREAEPE
jgi:hypothetical protein